MAWLATVEANTLVGVLHVSGRLLHVAKLHGYYVWVPILSWMVDSILLLILSAILLILSAILKLLNKLLLVHGGGEVESYFSSFSCHDGIGDCCWLIQQNVHSNLGLQTFYKLIQSVGLCYYCVTQLEAQVTMF